MSYVHIAPEVVMTDIAKLSSAMLFGSRSMASRPAKEGFDPAVMIGAQITDTTDWAQSVVYTTDWDFSAPATQENHDILLNAGYIYYPPADLSYKDDLTEGVYIKTYHPPFDISNPIIYTDPPIANVILRNDHALFCQVWNSIDPEFYYKYIWKRSPNYDGQYLSLTKEKIRDIMNQLFKTAKEMV